MHRKTSYQLGKRVNIGGVYILSRNYSWCLISIGRIYLQLVGRVKSHVKNYSYGVFCYMIDLSMIRIVNVLSHR